MTVGIVGKVKGFPNNLRVNRGKIKLFSSILMIREKLRFKTMAFLE